MKYPKSVQKKIDILDTYAVNDHENGVNVYVAYPKGGTSV